MNTAITTPGRRPAQRARHADRDGRPGPDQPRTGERRPTTSVSSRYNVHRSTTTPFTPSAANRIAQPTGDDLHRHQVSRRERPTTTGSPPRTPLATSARPSNEASATPLADTTPPTAPSGLTATGTSGQVALTGRRRPTRAGRALQRPSFDHRRLHAVGGEPHRSADRALRTTTAASPAVRPTTTA